MTDRNRYARTGKFLAVQIDGGQLDAIAKELAGTEEEINLALKRAINRTVTWMKTRARRALSKGLKIPSRVIQARLKHSMYKPETGLARVWLGLNPISAGRLKPRKTKKGIAISSGDTYQNSFIATGRNGNRHVYRREGKERVPIESVYKDIQAGHEIFEDQVFEGWESFLYKRFEHELKWQSRKKSI